MLVPFISFSVFESSAAVIYSPAPHGVSNASGTEVIAPHPPPKGFDFELHRAGHTHEKFEGIRGRMRAMVF